MQNITSTLTLQLRYKVTQNRFDNRNLKCKHPEENIKEKLNDNFLSMAYNESINEMWAMQLSGRVLIYHTENLGSTYNISNTK